MEQSSNDLIIFKLLLGLRDLDEVGNVGIIDLARDAKIEYLDINETIQADEYLDRHIYLIEGEVELIAEDKALQSVQADTERAKLPIFRVHTHGLYAKCTQRARLLSLNEATFERYVDTIRPKQNTGIAVDDYQPTQEESSLLGEVRHLFHHQEIDLPSMPEVALRINTAIQDEEVGLEQVAALIQTDPIISARVVQVANSAMFSVGQQVQAVLSAVQRIGLMATRGIVMSVVLKNLFVPTSKIIGKRMRSYYHHSIRVAAVSHVLAKNIPGFDPEQAFLAGLIHDIGVVPILIQADSRADLMESPDFLEHMINDLASKAGSLLLQQWGFEKEFVELARDSEKWEREIPAADYCDIVQVAQLHCVMVGGRKILAPAIKDLPAFHRLKLKDLDPLEIIEQSRQEIHNIAHIFE